MMELSKNDMLENMLKNKLLNSCHVDFIFTETKKAIYFYYFYGMQITLILTYDLKNKITHEKYNCINCINKKKIINANYENFCKKLKLQNKKDKLIRSWAENNEYKFISSNLYEHIKKCDKYINNFEENKEYLHLSVNHVISGLYIYRSLRSNNNLLINIYDDYFAKNGNCTYYIYLSKNKEYYVIMVNEKGIIDGYQKVNDETWFKNNM